MLRLLIFLVTLGVRALRAVFRTREELLIENLALRQQVMALKNKRARPVLDDVDRAFWVALRASWPGWASRLVIVNPDTVAKWHRDRFRLYWARISQQKKGLGHVSNMMTGLDPRASERPFPQLMRLAVRSGSNRRTTTHADTSTSDRKS